MHNIKGTRKIGDTTTSYEVQAIPYDVVMKVINLNPYMFSPMIYGAVNSLIFINQAPVVGGATAVVDQLSLAPGASLSIPGESFEIMDHEFICIFTGGGAQNLVAVMKIYM
jgi:hypothetical protein